MKYLKDEKGLVRAVTTDSLQLEKPLANVNYDVNVFNRNMDKVDAAIHEVKGKVDGLELTAQRVSIADPTNKFEATNVEDALLENKTSILSLVTKTDTTNSELSKIKTEFGKYRYMPNMLLNSHFKVNQEGITNHADFQNNRRRYVCDMWLINTLSEENLSDMYVANLENRLATKAIPGVELGQYITRDTLSLIKGKTVALSFHIDTLTTCEYKLSVYNTNVNLHQNVKASGRHQIISATFTIPENSADDRSYVCFEIINSEDPTAWFDIYYGKLEINSNATECVPAAYEIELLNCRRYYEKRYINKLNTLYSKDWMHFYIPIVEKYITPTCHFEGFKIKGTYTGNEISGFTLDNISNATDWLQVNAFKSSHGLTVSTIDGYYIADARLW